jgi:sugar phosphate isomerase/epimerase
MTRRDFLHRSVQAAAVGAVASTLPHALAASARTAPGFVRLGGPVFKAPADPDGLARAHRELGYRAAYCPNIPLTETDRIRAVSAAFAKHDVTLAEVGRWCNLLDADAAKRQENLDRVIDGLALAEAIGARCCVNIAGSYSTTEWYGPHQNNLSPKFFDAVVENARRIIDAVKPQRASFAYEMMGWSLPDSPENALRLLKAVDRKRFGIHLDPCNLVNSPTRFYDNQALLNECFDKLGKYIVSCHAKDLKWIAEMNVHFVEVVPGQGQLDYATYLQRLAKLPQQPPLMLEHLKTAEEYQAGRNYILQTGQAAGVAFGGA